MDAKRTHAALNVLSLLAVLALSVGLAVAPVLPAQRAQAASPITLDGAVSTSTLASGASISFSHTTGTGTDRLLLVGVSWNAGTCTTCTISSVTFTPSGESALSLAEVVSRKYSGNYRYSAIWYLQSPPSGKAGEVQVVFGGTVTNGIVAGAANFAGVDGTSPLGSPIGADAQSSSISVTLTGLVGDELVFDSIFVGGNPPAAATPGAGQSQLGAWNSSVSNGRGAASIEQASGSSVVMDWTLGGSGIWVSVAVPIRPACAGGRYTLTVDDDGNGAVTLDPAGGSYCSGQSVTLTPVPNLGYAFSGWTGANADDIDDTGGVYTIVMDSDKSVTANFALITHDLTVAVDPAEGGSTTPSPGSHAYAEGSVVDVTAVANPGYVFDHWSGACTGDGPCQVTLDADKTVTAHFALAAVITHVGDIGSAASTTEDGTLTIGVNTDVAVGDTIVVAVASRGDPNLAYSVSDSAGNTYTQAVQSTSYQHGRGYIFYAYVTTALDSDDTITITNTPAAGVIGRAAVASIFRGIAQNGLDQALGYPLSSDTPVTSDSPSVGPVTTSQADELLVGAVATEGPVSDDAGTWANGFTAGPRDGTTGATYNWTASLGYRIVSAAGGYTAAKAGITPQYWAATIATFRAGPATTTYELQINADPDAGGTTTPTSGTHTYAEGRVVDISATAAAGYLFDHWSGDCSGSGACQVTMNSDKSVTAHFVQRFTLDYAAGTGGSLTGDTSQVVTYGGNGTPVTAVPDTGYHFVNWSDGSTDNPRQDTNVTADVDVTANFAINTYTLDYAAGTGGTLTGAASQVVDYGEDGTPVAAVPDTGYHFVNWSDGSTDNPRQDTSVTADVDVTANFAINTYTLDYAAGAGGSLTGDTSQVVTYDRSGTPVTAVPNTGYHFVNWSDGSTANPRQDTNVTADVDVTANFALDTFTLDYAAGTGGSLTGDASQVVTYGGSGTPVTAVPNTGYYFVNWSDGSTANPRQDTNVTANLAVTANFELVPPVQYRLTMAVDPAGGGTTTPPAGTHSYTAGAVVDITAVAADGYVFDSWSGACSGSGTCQVTMDADKSVTAHFVEAAPAPAHRHYLPIVLH